MRMSVTGWQGRWQVVLAGVVVAIVMFGLSSAHAQAVMVQQQTITQSLGATGSLFGSSVAISGDGNTALIGARFDTVGSNSRQGSATIFTRTGSSWTEQRFLTQSNGAADDSFGISVALSSDGNTALIGAHGDDARQGSATIFTRTGTSWTEQRILTQSNGLAGDVFGVSVALSSDGNTALIGAQTDTVGTNSSQGSATIFTRTGTSWTEQQTITQSDGASNDRFGASVALSSDGNTALIGAYSDDAGSNANQGSATIFTRTGASWTEQRILTQSNGAADDWFGVSVALSSDGNTALIGARFDDAGSNADQGSATIFTRAGTSWTEQQTITQSNGASSDSFGVWVALSSDGNTALIGAELGDAGSNANQGSGTIFTRTGTSWTEQQTITQSDGASNDSFGLSVALSSDGNTALIGAHGHNLGRGSATIFVSPPGPPTGVTAAAADASAVVTWTAPSSDGGATITRYDVTANPGGQSCSTTTVAPATPQTTCTITGLTNGSSYTFTVTAMNAAGQSIASAPSTPVTPATPITPAANSTAPTTLKSNQIRGSQTGTTTQPIPYVITNVAADVTRILVAATLQTPKTSTADRLLKKSTLVRGTCTIKTHKKTKKRTAQCSILLKRAGTWLVTFTPRTKTTTGTATSKKITIRTPVKPKTTARLLNTRQL
jgi:hypothetical protein